MTGILKFFKPTDGGGVNSKKAERCSLNTTAREPFSPVGNTDGAQRPLHQPNDPSDTDAELAGDEVPTGSKRKRGANGAIAKSGPNAAPGAGRPEDAVARTSLQQLNVSGSLKADQLQNHDDAAMADVEERPAEKEPAASSPKATPRLEATGPATATTAQMLSPEMLSPHQPSAKRPRLPGETDAPAGAQAQHPPSAQQPQQPQQLEEIHLDQPGAVGNGTDTDVCAGSTPLPSAKPAEATGPQEQQQGNSHNSPSQRSDDGAGEPAGAATAAAAAGAGPGTAGTGAKSGGTGLATLPPELDVQSTVESLRRAQGQLEAALEEEMLLESGLEAAAAASEAGRLALMPHSGELCTWLEGRTQPLSALLTRLEAILPSGTEPTAVRTALVDLAQRKCYSAKDAPLEGVAASEDVTPGRLWVWEVRDPKKHLPDKAARKLVDLQRKRRKELRERLTAVGIALDTLAAHQALQAGSAQVPPAKTPSAAARRTAESRAAKAWNRLGKLPDLEAIEGAYRSASGDLAAAGGTAGPAKKERERKDKEEKARQKEEEARAKEAKRVQEEEAKRRAREAATANKAGFASSKGLRKSQNIMESFFKRPKTTHGAHSGGPPAAGAAQDVAASLAPSTAGAAAEVSMGAGPIVIDLSTGCSQPQHTGGQSQAAAGGSGGGGGHPGSSQPAAATPARECRTMFVFSKLTCRAPDAAVVAALDVDAARLPLGLPYVEGDLQRNHQRWRQQRAARRRMIGVPPTWARRPTAPTDIRVLAALYYGDVAALGLAPEGLRTWRRKLIAFPAKESARPPYYGSFSRTSTRVTGRRPFGHDPSLDYEVASDEEWEEEPEGESLSDSGDEADSQAGGGPGEGGEEEDDGFIVGDDHLSDDEGAQLSGDPDDPMDVDGATLKAARAAAAAATTAPRHVDPRLQQLEAAIDRVRTNNRPILLVRQPTTTTTTTTTMAAPLLPGASPALRAPLTPGGGGASAAAPGSAVVGAALPGQLRAEPRPGLNTGLDPGLLGALRPVVHRPDAALAPPLELDVFSAFAAATGGTAGAGVGAGAPGAAAGGLGLGLAGEEGATGAFAAAPELHFAPQSGGPGTAGPAAGRAPGSGHRGRAPAASLNEATLTALAEFMAGAGDQKMEKIVEGFLASVPPGVKLPAKIKLREAIKRLGSWSHSAKRWILQGGSVAAAVAHALEVAAATAAAAAAAGSGGRGPEGTPLPPVGPAAARGLGAAMGVTGTPIPLLGTQGLPAPTPLPRLGPLPSPLPTPSTAAGGRPLLPAPACTPLDAAAAAQRPTGHQVMVPQQLAQALAKLAADGPTAPSPATSALTGDPTTGLATPGAAAVTPASALGGARLAALTSAQKLLPPMSAQKLLPPMSAPRAGGTNGNGNGTSSMFDMCIGRVGSTSLAAGPGVEAILPTPASTAAAAAAEPAAAAAVELMNCDVQRPEARLAVDGGEAGRHPPGMGPSGPEPGQEDGAGMRAALPGGSAAFGSDGVGGGIGIGAVGGVPVGDGSNACGGGGGSGGDRRGSEAPLQQCCGLEAAEPGAGCGAAQGGMVEAVKGAVTAGARTGGDGQGIPGPDAGAAAAATGLSTAHTASLRAGKEQVLADEEVEVEAGLLPRPMPPPLPSAAEMAAAGAAHPYWRALISWVLGGGGAAARARKHGPSWADVSSALAVFEAGELEPRLPAMPLDVVRALVSVCQHRRPSHLRSGAFKALGNVAAALAAARTTTAGGDGGGGGGPGAGGGRRRGLRQDGGKAPPGGTDVGSSAAATDAVEAAGALAPEHPPGVPTVPARPTGQPSRCSPQTVSLPALWRLPGLLAALRRGCCGEATDLDSETDKAPRGAARVLAALVGVGIRPLSPVAPFAALQQRQEQGQGRLDVQQASPDAASPSLVGECRAAAEAPQSSVLPAALAAAAAAFRLQVAADPGLHAALRDVAMHPSGASASSARCIYNAHMLLALQRLLRDPVAASLVTKPKARVARERAAAAEGRPAPPPPNPDLEAKWAAKLLQNLVVGGREIVHPGCRKCLTQCAVSLLEHPRLAGLMAPPPQNPAADGEGGAGEKEQAPGGAAARRQPAGVGALLTGNDPRVQLPALCLTLLSSELRFLAASSEGGDGAEGPSLDKCTRVRVLLALHAAERALRHLSQPSAASQQQRRQADTKAAVANVLTALEEAGGALYDGQDALLQNLCTTVGGLAEELT